MEMQMSEDTRPEDSGDEHFWRTFRTVVFLAIGFVIGLILGYKASGGENALAGWATMAACLITAYALSRISPGSDSTSAENSADDDHHFFERDSFDRDEPQAPGPAPSAADTSPEPQAEDRTRAWEDWLLADLLDEDGDGDPTVR